MLIIPGKIYALFKGNQHDTQVAYVDYKSWFTKPWPRKSYSDSLNVSSQGLSKTVNQKL
ncbi:hypothetical protein DPMN_129658 [Dreissena polymorpha]|uniref:Uncharacterized protein n=1 Tax=Dreissena polymorpha TaxID=45954 RepID=A0A9D4H9G5_DREPO|nr:hypothetical protein DPMN_129658 [Dreissena polymorpha]